MAAQLGNCEEGAESERPAPLFQCCICAACPQAGTVPVDGPPANRQDAFRGITMDGVERFFLALTIVGLAALFATLTWAGLIWLGGVAAGH